MTYASFWLLFNMLAPGIEAAREAYYGYEKKGEELVAILLNRQFRVVPSRVLFVLLMHCVILQAGHHTT
jgi:hypothetical protein